MPTLNPNRPIGRLATEHPEFVPVFEEMGLDYCCDGHRSLVDACLVKGLRPSEVLDRLDEREGAARPSVGTWSVGDWFERPIDDLIDHIVEEHHEYLRRELPRLESLLEKVTHVHGTEAPWIGSVKKEFEALKPDLEAHIETEETVVFPFLRTLDDDHAPAAEEDDPLARIERAHKEVGTALKRIRMLCFNYTAPMGACNSFRAAIDGLHELESNVHQHVHKENNILFPRVRKRL